MVRFLTARKNIGSWLKTNLSRIYTNQTFIYQICSQVQYIHRQNAIYKTTHLSLTMFKRENAPKTKPSDDAYLSRAALQEAQGYL